MSRPLPDFAMILQIISILALCALALMGLNAGGMISLSDHYQVIGSVLAVLCLVMVVVAIRVKFKK